MLATKVPRTSFTLKRHRAFIDGDHDAHAYEVIRCATPIGFVWQYQGKWHCGREFACSNSSGGFRTRKNAVVQLDKYISPL